MDKNERKALEEAFFKQLKTELKTASKEKWLAVVSVLAFLSVISAIAFLLWLYG